MDTLSPLQQERLQSFQAVTNQDNVEESISILEDADWDVQVAVTYVFDRPSPAASTSSRRVEPMEIEDAAHSYPNSPSPYWLWIRQVLAGPTRIFAWPLSMIYGAATLVLGFLARVLRIRPILPLLRPRNPFSTSSSSLNPYAGRKLSPTAAAERWLRSVEELTGAHPDAPTQTYAATSSQPHVSAAHRRGGEPTSAKALPPFFMGGYEAAVNTAKQELRVMLAILTCEEHEDDEVFKKSVLTDPVLVESIRTNNILCWAGDTRERDAYTASKALQFHRLPFVAFIALQHVPGTAMQRMSVIARLEGSPALDTSAANIVSQLTHTVVPRTSPLLGRLRAERASREAERRLRDEQDQAFRLAGERDVARVLKRRQEEDARRRALDADAARRAREAEQEEIDIQKRQRRYMWRLWRRNHSTPEPADGVRVAVVLGDGRRVTRRFTLESTVEELYEYVECILEERRDAEFEANGTLFTPDKLGTVEKDPNYVFEFKLATTLPRQMIPADSAQDRAAQLQNTPALASGATLIVEGWSGRHSVDSDEEEEEEEEEG